MPHLSFLFLVLLLGLAPLRAQPDATTGRIYYQVTKIKSTDADLLQVENTLMLPYFQARVNEGSQLWHGFYRLTSPIPGQAGFEYISVDVYDNLSELHLPPAGVDQIVQQTFPHTTPEQFWERVEAVTEVQSAVTYTISSALFPPPSSRGEQSAPLLSINYMVVTPGREADYVAMENEVFKPIMARHVRQNALQSWSLFERAIPIGTEFGANFVTVDAFANWDQVQAYQENWQATAIATHPDLNMDEVMGRLTGMREHLRMEVWELERETTPPATEPITFQIIQEGSGPKPMRGQEITWSGQVMNDRGETLFETSSLGNNWQDIVGSDPSNTRWNEAVMMVGAGGIVQVNVPESSQGWRERQRNGGGTLVIKINVQRVDPPANYGHEKLKHLLTTRGLEAAQQWYAGLQRDNPNGYVFREMQMNALGYDLMAEGMEEEAIYVLDLNRQNFPDSFNVYDSLADAYSNAGNDFHAREHFQTAMKKNPGTSATTDKPGKMK